MAYIIFENLNLRFGKTGILTNFNLTVEKGDKLVFKAASGTGKTTLLNVLLGFERRFESGRILFENQALDGVSIKPFRQMISWVPQDTGFFRGKVSAFLDWPFSFKANKHLKPSTEEVLRILYELGLNEDILHKTTDSISGGEKQRMAIAVALLLKKDIFVADEPTSALDENSRDIVSRLILNNSALTVISASHDATWIDKCTKIVEL